MATDSPTTHHRTKYPSRDNVSLLRQIGCVLAFLPFFLFTFSLFSDAAAQQKFRLRINQSVVDEYLSEDIAAEIAFGKQVAAHVLGKLPLLESPILTRYVSLVGKTLVQHASRDDINFHFAVLNDARANAFSTPGGYVFITLGAIELAQDEAELAAILAHEIAHINARHIVNAIKIRGSDSSQVSGFIRFLGAAGNTGQVALGQAVDKAIALLFQEGFNKTQELEADRLATYLLAETGYDPTALSRYLQRLHNQTSHGLADSSTHPTSHQRLDKLHTLQKLEGLLNITFPKAKKRFDHYIKLAKDGTQK